jgi:hypothetical protein
MRKFNTATNYSQGLHIEALGDVSRCQVNAIAGASTTARKHHQLHNNACSSYNTAATNRASSSCTSYDGIHCGSSNAATTEHGSRSYAASSCSNFDDLCPDESAGNSTLSSCSYFDLIPGASSTRRILHIYNDASS